MPEVKQPLEDTEGLVALQETAAAAKGPAVMYAGDTFFMFLMPLANVVSVALVAWVGWGRAAGREDQAPAIMHVAGGLSAFFTLWALRNYFLGGNKRERGMVTMGLVFIGFVIDAAVQSVAGHIVALVGALGVVLSFVAVVFLFPYTKCCGGKTYEELAARSSKSVLWAKILRCYMSVSLLTWIAIMALLIDSTANRDSIAAKETAKVTAAATGKVWVECGPACPKVCGKTPAQMCITMCMEPGWYCGGETSWWDSAKNKCVGQGNCLG